MARSYAPGTANIDKLLHLDEIAVTRVSAY